MAFVTQFAFYDLIDVRYWLAIFVVDQICLLLLARYVCWYPGLLIWDHIVFSCALCVCQDVDQALFVIGPTGLLLARHECFEPIILIVILTCFLLVRQFYSWHECYEPIILIINMLPIAQTCLLLVRRACCRLDMFVIGQSYLLLATGFVLTVMLAVVHVWCSLNKFVVGQRG